MLAEGEQTVIEPQEESWDLVLLVGYPSRAAFLKMIGDWVFQAAHEHRAAALSDSRLICCTALDG